jgi:hypothetical protein
MPAGASILDKSTPGVVGRTALSVLGSPKWASRAAVLGPAIYRVLAPVAGSAAEKPGDEQSYIDAATPQPTPRGQLVPGNIDLHSRPVSKNPDGSFSTVNSMSFSTDQGETLVPGVARDGSGIISPEAAIEQYRRTGEHLGIFRTPEDADAYAQRLHEDQAREYGPQMGETGPHATDYPSRPPLMRPRIPRQMWEQ